MFLWLLLSCGAEPAPPSAADIAYGDTTVAAALDQLAAQKATAAAPTAPDTPSPAEVLRMEERLVRLELALVEVQGQGVLPAKSISYDPSLSGLSGRTTQEALDDIGTRLARLESSLGQDMGQAGPGLGRSSQGGQQGGMQGRSMQGGQQGGMQGGQQGGMQGGQQGGMQGGQQGGQQGGMQGGQQGGMQGGQGGR